MGWKLESASQLSIPLHNSPAANSHSSGYAWEVFASCNKANRPIDLTMDQGFYEFGPFRLDARERVLLRAGRLVPLAPKVLNTLLTLVRHQGRVVEKETLMDEVWPDEAVEEGNLTQHIFMLRKVLGEDNGDQEYIETVPRRGYRFVANVTHGTHETDYRAVSSLAILPFINVSADPNMEYLSDGITESIIGTLSRLTQLKVIAQGTVSRFKGLAPNPRDVGNELGVRAVMMGRVEQRADRLIISAELVNVQDGSRIWGHQYHKRPADIFDLQEELAGDISENLRIRLTGAQKEKLGKRPTHSMEAYELYLRGRHCWSKRTNREQKTGFEYFRQAIAKDPAFSVAYVGMSDCILVIGLFGSEAPRLAMLHWRRSGSITIGTGLEPGGTIRKLCGSVRLIRRRTNGTAHFWLPWAMRSRHSRSYVTPVSSIPFPRSLTRISVWLFTGSVTTTLLSNACDGPLSWSPGSFARTFTLECHTSAKECIVKPSTNWKKPGPSTRTHGPSLALDTPSPQWARESRPRN
jgi:TolB-like protein